MKLKRNMANIYAIGDIHGCYTELMKLMEQLPINYEEDTIVFLGDYIDRGPDTSKVIQQLIEWKAKYPHWVMLYGNHEDLMLDALVYGGRKYHSYDLWYGQGGKETVHSYLPQNLSAYEKAIVQPEDVIIVDHLSFLTTLPRYYETEDYIFVHAGLRPGVSLEEQDERDLIWIRDEFIGSDFDFGKKVIFGHTARKDFSPWVMDNKIGIDTAVCPGANYKLTAVRLPDEQFFEQPSERILE